MIYCPDQTPLATLAVAAAAASPVNASPIQSAISEEASVPCASSASFLPSRAASPLSSVCSVDRQDSFLDAASCLALIEGSMPAAQHEIFKKREEEGYV